MINKDKDPAFLFYTKDFYEGTRTMMPEERACYIDLLIYQHQNDIIPDDITKLKLYCSGCKKNTIVSVLNAKFIKEEDGWVNIKLKQVSDARKSFSNKQSINGKIGQFFKKSKEILSKQEYTTLQKKLNVFDNFEILKVLNDNNINTNEAKAMLKAKLLALLKHLVIVNVNEDVNEEDNEEQEENIDPDFELPDWNKFIAYYNEHIGERPTKVSSFTPKRKRLATVIVKKYGKKKVREVIEKVRKSDFLQGRVATEKHQNWKASFDWVFTEDSFVNILEGKHDNRSKEKKDKLKYGSELMKEEQESLRTAAN